MTYSHLTREERYQIYELRIENKTITEIAAALNRHKSTISRELKRNCGAHRWRPNQAQRISQARGKQSRNARRVSEADWEAVADYIRLDLSPDQAILRLSLENNQLVAISRDTVYKRIYARQKEEDELFKHLRSQKPRRKRHLSRARGIPIKNRVSIDERPEIVDRKTRLGDWEGDTVIGKGQQGILLTLVERYSRYSLAALLDSRQAGGVATAINHLLLPHKDKCHTITFDNGLEFAKHADVTKCLDAGVYFAHPYHSWERGLNENTNGLIRQYHPKSVNLKTVSTSNIQTTMDKLNHRPRKCLGYKTPHEVFYNLGILPLKTYLRCTS